MTHPWCKICIITYTVCSELLNGSLYCCIDAIIYLQTYMRKSYSVHVVCFNIAIDGWKQFLCYVRPVYGTTTFNCSPRSQNLNVISVIMLQPYQLACLQLYHCLLLYLIVIFFMCCIKLLYCYGNLSTYPPTEALKIQKIWHKTHIIIKYIIWVKKRYLLNYQKKHSKIY